jgi:hypothetical protein
LCISSVTFGLDHPLASVPARQPEGDSLLAAAPAAVGVDGKQREKGFPQHSDNNRPTAVVVMLSNVHEWQCK